MSKSGNTFRWREFVAMDLLRLWMNLAASGTGPEIVVRVGPYLQRAKFSPKWDGRVVEVEIDEAEAHAQRSVEEFRTVVLLPLLWKLLPPRHRKTALRNRVLASMRIQPVDEWVMSAG